MSEPSINLADIAQAVAVIERASARGAVDVSEMAEVGQLYQRLTDFLTFARTQLTSETTQGDSNA